jgi:aldehyde dehydrogenase (NAD+)
LKIFDKMDRLIKIRDYFNAGITKDYGFRVKQLEILKNAIIEFLPEIEKALKIDLGKSPEEAYLTEIALVLDEIDYHSGNLKKWMKPGKVSSALALFPSKSRIIHEPLGVVLIMSPWNYPFQLLINPLVGAISAGNCAVLKPSAQTPNVTAVLKKLFVKYFNSEYIMLIDGNHEEINWIFGFRFDHIFFTGGTEGGKNILEKAATQLCPVTLELGGKSPCLVFEGIDLQLAAKRIVFGKYINAGQTCIAPDYILVDEKIKDNLITALMGAITGFHGENPVNSLHYGRIVSERAFNRLKNIIEESGKSLVFGGENDRDSKFISPSIFDNPSVDESIMKYEIFGPLLPIISVKSVDEAIKFINSREKPLALYYFGKFKNGMYVIRKTTSGGACINDTILHVANKNLPFGGVGNSGMGRYHGRESFNLFSNHRSLLISSRKVDFSIKYPPYKNFALLKKLL